MQIAPYRATNGINFVGLQSSGVFAITSDLGVLAPDDQTFTS